jgi:flagellar basal-body rod protein FlgB
MIDATLSILEKSLEMRARAHEIHASNVANANVPGYKAKKIDFEGRLREAMQELDAPNEPMVKTHRLASGTVGEVVPDIYEDPLAKASGDGNTVQMEHEQAEIAKNTIAYQAGIQLINKKFALAKYVLSEGGR